MSTRDEIIQAIDKIVHFYPGWTIGVTSDLERSRKEHGSPRFWYKWKAESAEEASTVKMHFLGKRMKSGTDISSKATHVFIFLR